MCEKCFFREVWGLDMRARTTKCDIKLLPRETVTGRRLWYVMNIKYLATSFSASFWGFMCRARCLPAHRFITIKRNNFGPFVGFREHKQETFFFRSSFYFRLHAHRPTECDHKINKNKFVYFQFWDDYERHRWTLRDDDIITLRVLHLEICQKWLHNCRFM